jgi:hypothetical protein
LPEKLQRKRYLGFLADSNREVTIQFLDELRGEEKTDETISQYGIQEL